MVDYPPRPPTPQAMLHRLPDKPDNPPTASEKPSKFIVLIIASTAVAGKVQIAKSVSTALSCPLFQGDSLHETVARAASVGASVRAPTTAGIDVHGEVSSGVSAKESRYQRMWLSKMTRTGLLFPEESRPAGGEFSGFGGASSTSTSRRGSASSVASDRSSFDASSVASRVMSGGATKYMNKPPATAPHFDNESLQSANPALVVVTHPKLESWHERCIRRAVGEYSIGVILIPLDKDEDEEDLPVLKPLDPRSITSFGSLDAPDATRQVVPPIWNEEMVLRVNVESKVEDLAKQIADGVQNIMSA